MEQHNIDSRFKKGLENLNRQPSQDAWARLQSQMNAPVAATEPEISAPEEKEERRVLVWWHYAAAAVVLLFISVGIIKNGTNLDGKTAQQIAVNQPKEISNTPEKRIEVQAPAIVEETAPETAIASTESKETETEKAFKNGSQNEVKTGIEVSSQKQVAQLAPRVKKKKLILVDPEKKPVADKKTAKPEETMLASNTQPVTPKAETQNVKPSGLAGMAIEVIVKKDNSENLLAMHTPENNEEKDSKIKSIFKQARNLKNGEKVDLQALGVTSDSKLAMGTRSLHEKFTKVLDI